MEVKAFKAEVKEFNDKDLTITHFISTEEVDRSGDIMLADGMTMRGMPAVLKEHGFDPAQGREPIAKPLNITIGTDAKGNKGILVTTQYYDGSSLVPPDNTGRRLYEKAKGGFMDKWSIGFMVMDASPRAGGGRKVAKWELLEYSQVGVPDNMGATTAKGEYQLDVKMVEQPAVPAAPVADAVAPVVPAASGTPAADTAVPTESVSMKSIAERVMTEIPHRALMSITDAFFYELYNCEEEKQVNALLKEFVDMAKPHCIAMMNAMNSYREKSTPEELAEYKSKFRISIKSSDSSEPSGAADQSPSQEPAPSSETPAAAVEQPAGSASVAEDDGVVFDESVTGQAPAAQPVDDGVELPVTSAELTEIVAAETGKAIRAELDRMRGRILN